ncbi:MAG: SDR family oxidoreductase, partial [candidate division Zixibacteria bacterium]|nr:SDR family oxidoreductase [candidate division Zixibacteria bacterium]
DYDAEGVKQAAAKLEKDGYKAAYYVTDVSDEGQVVELFKSIAKDGPLDVLVNNAGIINDKLMIRITKDDWDRVIHINLTGAFLCSREAAKLMLKSRKGRIVNISSMVAIAGNVGQANYCASKAGIIGLTKSNARELGPKGITVNAVAPGFIITEMTDTLPEANKEAYLKNMSIKRPGTPEDVANAVIFFASEETSFITGQVLIVDGGFTM